MAVADPVAMAVELFLSTAKHVAMALIPRLDKDSFFLVTVEPIIMAVVTGPDEDFFLAAAKFVDVDVVTEPDGDFFFL